MPIRILEIHEGDPLSRTVTLRWAQDEFSIPQGAYVQPPPSHWVAPDTTPQPVARQTAFEASYRDLVRALGPGPLQALTDTAGFVAAAGTHPPGTVAYGFELCSRQGSADFVQRSRGSFCPWGRLAAALGPGDTAVTLTGFEDLSSVRPGAAARIDGEWVRVDTVNAATGALTVGRGCVDTPPVPHAQGAEVWFPEDHAAHDPTDYLPGETVDLKLLTVTSAGLLDPALAASLSVVMKQRAARPYPPGRLLVQGRAWPDAITGALALTWAHRSRLLQADPLIDTTQGSIGPEAGTTYTVRIYLDGVLDSATAGLTGTRLTPEISGDGTVQIQIDAIRDGLTSWQPLTATLARYRRGTPRPDRAALVAAARRLRDGGDA